MISGIAFGKNLWNHAYNSARNYYYAYNNVISNKGTALRYITFDDVVSFCKKGISGIEYIFTVPVISNNRNKILYMVE